MKTTCPHQGCPIDRRSFLTAAAAASVTLALAACGDGQIGGVFGPPLLGTGTLTLNVGDFAGLATVGGVARVTTTGAPIAVYRNGAASYLAFSMACPHAGTTVTVSAAGFVCPNHGARFAKDGTWLGGQSSAALVSLPATFDPLTGALTISSVATSPPGEEDDDDEEPDDDPSEERSLGTR